MREMTTKTKKVKILDQINADFEALARRLLLKKEKNHG